MLSIMPYIITYLIFIIHWKIRTMILKRLSEKKKKLKIVVQKYENIQVGVICSACSDHRNNLKCENIYNLKRPNNMFAIIMYCVIIILSSFFTLGLSTIYMSI